MRPASNLVTLVWLLASLVSASAHDIPQKLEELSLTPVAKRIYVVHGIQALPDKSNKGFMSNTGIILTQTGIVVIDSGGSAQVAQLIVSKVREITDKPIIALFNTHVHGDHWLGNAVIREAFPNVRIFAHEIAIERLKNGEAERWIEIFMRLTEGAVEGTEAVLPDQRLKGGETITIGGTTFNTHYTGHAHTDSDIMIEVPDARTLFTGDIVEHGHAVSSDVPQDFDAKGQIAAIEYALKLSVETFVPGHGTSGGKEIPEAALRFLKILYESVNQYYHDGLRDYEMRDRVANDLSEFSYWFNFDQLGRLISYVFQQVEAADFR